VSERPLSVGLSRCIPFERPISSIGWESSRLPNPMSFTSSTTWMLARKTAFDSLDSLLGTPCPAGALNAS